jgi:hypothetical protein
MFIQSYKMLFQGWITTVRQTAHSLYPIKIILISIDIKRKRRTSKRQQGGFSVLLSFKNRVVKSTVTFFTKRGQTFIPIHSFFSANRAIFKNRRYLSPYHCRHFDYSRFTATKFFLICERLIKRFFFSLPTAEVTLPRSATEKKQQQSGRFDRASLVVTYKRE